MPNKQHYLPMLIVWGAVFGFVDAIPAFCCCFFLWFGLAGLLSVKSVTDKAGVTVQIGEGVLIGLLAGVIAGGLAGLISGAMVAAMGPAIINMYRGLGIPPAQLAQLEAQLGNPIVGFFQNFCLNIVLGPVMGCLGGLIGTQVFKKG
jgi:hypothetical protein